MFNRYHADGSFEMRLPSIVNNSYVRSAFDWLLWYYSPTLIADYLGVSMVGPHNILISPALITSLTTRGIVCDVWVCNSDLEKRWLKSLGCVVTSDYLFSYDDVSPFIASPEPTTLNNNVGGKVAKRPSIHSAEQFLHHSFYIHSHQSSPIPDSDTSQSPPQHSRIPKIHQLPLPPPLLIVSDVSTAIKASPAVKSSSIASSNSIAPIVSLSSPNEPSASPCTPSPLPLSSPFTSDDDSLSTISLKSTSSNSSSVQLPYVQIGKGSVNMTHLSPHARELVLHPGQHHHEMVEIDEYGHHARDAAPEPAVTSSCTESPSGFLNDEIHSDHCDTEITTNEQDDEIDEATLTPDPSPAQQQHTVSITAAGKTTYNTSDSDIVVVESEAAVTSPASSVTSAIRSSSASKRKKSVRAD